jgi:hypothetical protein
MEDLPASELHHSSSRSINKEAATTREHHVIIIVRFHIERVVHTQGR